MKYGGKLSSIDLRDYRLDLIGLLKIKLPDTYEINMIHNVKLQKANSCTSQAISSTLEYFDDNRCRLSTNFIYGLKHKLFNSEGKGETLRDALKIVKDYGDPAYEFCEGDTEVDEVYKIAEESFNNEECLNDAYKHKIDKYIKLFTKKQIKYALMTYGPVLVCTKWYSKYNINKYTGQLTVNKKSNYSYHSFLIYGWNEFGWLCQNSWGDKWGKNGLFNVEYSYNLNDVFVAVDNKLLNSTSENVKIIKPGKWSRLLDKLLRINNKILNIFRRK